MIASAMTTVALAAFAPLTLAETSYADVQRFSGEVVDGSELFVRTDMGVAYTMNASDLEKDHAYTNWFVTFNKPALCDTACLCGADEDFEMDNAAEIGIGVFWATGRVADKLGQANFAAHADYGVLPAGVDQVPFPGLDSPIMEGAEVHIVTRDHGKKKKGSKLEAQLSEFNGGCPKDGCVDVQFAVNPSPTCVPPS
jgi:hypothetical protein